MRTILVLAATAALCPSAKAQTYETAPPGYVTKSATTSSFVGMKWHAYFRLGCRFQWGKVGPGAKAMLTQLDSRTAPNLAYRTYYGMGRRFSRFSLQLGHTDRSKFTSRFTLNYKSAGTVVYSGALSLPSNTAGKVKSVWGNCGSIAFTKKFAWNPTKAAPDLLEDFAHDGAQLANGGTATWVSYYSDGCSGRSIASDWFATAVGPGDLFGSKYVPRNPGTGTRCSDSGQTTFADAHTYVGGTIFNDSYWTTSLRGMYRPRIYVSSTVRSKPVLVVLSGGGSDAGLEVPGAKCNKLHVNMSHPVWISRTTTSSSGYTSWSPGVAKYSNSFAGTNVYGQHAWDDTKTGQLGLSIATKLVLVKKGQGAQTGCPPVSSCHRSRYSSTGWVPSATDAGLGQVRTTVKTYALHRYTRQ